MEKRLLYVFTISSLLFSCLFGFSGGNGSEGNPYQVSNAAELDSVRFFRSSHFIQTGDIDLGIAPWNTGSGWIPIGNSITRFTGSYDGQNHIISGLFVDNNSDIIGLFGNADGCTLEKINLVSIDIRGGSYVGGLVGGISGNSTIINCSCEGNLTGQYEVGGLVGYSQSSTISYCTSQCNVSGNSSIGGLLGTLEGGSFSNNTVNSNVVSTGDYVGGLIGYNYDNSSVSLSDFNGSVTGGSYIGGVIGYSLNSTIKECTSNSYIETSYAEAHPSSALIGGSENDSISYCYSTGTINGDECGGIVGEAIGSTVIKCNSDIIINGKGWGISGGLIGRCDATEVNYCFSSGSVSDDWVVGGLIGSAHNGSTISNSYSSADANCTIWSVGGFQGESYDSETSNCYSTGLVTGPDYYGGFCGYTENTIFFSCYWDTETSGQTTSDGGIGKATAQMKLQSTYSGWDYSTPVWNIHSSLNNGYPYLEWEGRIPVENPANLTLVQTGSMTTLTWDPVIGATEYVVYSSDDPYGTYSIDISGLFNGNEWNAPQSASKKFYYIVAKNSTK